VNAFVADSFDKSPDGIGSAEQFRVGEAVRRIVLLFGSKWGFGTDGFCGGCRFFLGSDDGLGHCLGLCGLRRIGFVIWRDNAAWGLF
jgi:hypothetical protein